jgi:hypothetical protein
VKHLQRRLARAEGGLAGLGLLRREVRALSRALLVERSRVKAMEEELESPLNVHRWLLAGWVVEDGLGMDSMGGWMPCYYACKRGGDAFRAVWRMRGGAWVV